MSGPRSQGAFTPFYLTGVGIVSPFGGGNEKFQSAIQEKRSGIKPISVFSGVDTGQKAAGEVTDFDPARILGKGGLRGFGRNTLMLMESIQHLLNARSTRGEQGFGFEPEHVSLVVGATGSIKADSDFDFQVLESPRHVVPSDFPSTLACVPAGYASIRFGIKSATLTFSNGETSSIDAIAFAGEQLNQGRSRLVLAGGVEELTLQYALIMQGVFRYLGLAMPPLGEGCAIFSCESKDSVQKKSDRALMEVIAYATNFNPDPDLAFRRNMDELRGMTDGVSIDRIETVFLSERGIAVETEMFPSVQQISISPLLGYMGAVSGAFKIAWALYSTEIRSDSIVLVNDISAEGNASSLLLRKL